MYNDVLEDSEQGDSVSEYDMFFKALPSGFLKENTKFEQGAKSCARVSFLLFHY